MGDVLRSRMMDHAVRSIRSRLSSGSKPHVHEFVEDADCPCGRSFDWVLEHRPVDPFVLELIPE